MPTMTPFLLDGIAYDVHVLDLTRKFSVQDTNKATRVQSGAMVRDLVGTFYNYELTVRPRNGNMRAVDDLWEALSQPVSYHVCVFPYNQTVLTQRMYVTDGKQPLKRLTVNKTYWGDLKISFIAMEPKVVP